MNWGFNPQPSAPDNSNPGYCDGRAEGHTLCDSIYRSYAKVNTFYL